MVKPKGWLIVLAVVILDQLTKFVFAKLVPGILVLVPQFLQLDKVYNTGAGFGTLQGTNSLLIWINIIVIGLIVYYYDEFSKRKLVLVGTALILAGALGNLIDRIFIGRVFDWISFSFWPSFNVADSAVTFGAILFISGYLKKK